jgi:hypothetical protein
MALIAMLWTWLSQTYATNKSLAHAMSNCVRQHCSHVILSYML